MIMIKTMSAKIPLLSGALFLAVCTSAYSDDSDCISRAEVENGVPVGLLTKMKAAESGARVHPEDDLHGPMAISGRSIELAAKGMHVSPGYIKKDTCQNYRAAAWLLMNVYGGKSTENIFSAVNSYYYGSQKRSTGRLTLEVKRLYQLEME